MEIMTKRQMMSDVEVNETLERAEQMIRDVFMNTPNDENSDRLAQTLGTLYATRFMIKLAQKTAKRGENESETPFSAKTNVERLYSEVDNFPIDTILHAAANGCGFDLSIGLHGMTNLFNGLLARALERGFDLERFEKNRCEVRRNQIRDNSTYYDKIVFYLP